MWNISNFVPGKYVGGRDPGFILPIGVVDLRSSYLMTFTKYLVEERTNDYLSL